MSDYKHAAPNGAQTNPRTRTFTEDTEEPFLPVRLRSLTFGQNSFVSEDYEAQLFGCILERVLFAGAGVCGSMRVRKLARVPRSGRGRYSGE